MTPELWAIFVYLGVSAGTTGRRINLSGRMPVGVVRAASDKPCSAVFMHPLTWLAAKKELATRDRKRLMP